MDVESSGFVTWTSRSVPAGAAGAEAVRRVALATVTPEARPAPIFRVAPGWNPYPSAVRAAPPDAGPESGESPATSGDAARARRAWSAAAARARESRRTVGSRNRRASDLFGLLTEF